MMEIAQSGMEAQPWDLELHSNGWQPNTKLGNYVIHPLYLETAQCTEPGSCQVPRNCAIFLGIVHGNFIGKEEKKKNEIIARK